MTKGFMALLIGCALSTSAFAYKSPPQKKENKSFVCITEFGTKKTVSEENACMDFSRAERVRVEKEKNDAYNAAMDKTKYKNVKCISGLGTVRDAKSSDDCLGYSKEAKQMEPKLGTRLLDSQ